MQTKSLGEFPYTGTPCTSIRMFHPHSLLSQEPCWFRRSHALGKMPKCFAIDAHSSLGLYQLEPVLLVDVKLTNKGDWEFQKGWLGGGKMVSWTSPTDHFTGFIHDSALVCPILSLKTIPYRCDPSPWSLINRKLVAQKSERLSKFREVSIETQINSELSYIYSPTKGVA